jgi:hypothetical protein
MTIRMTVTMTASAGRRYGGRSKYSVAREYKDKRAAVADLLDTFGGIRNQPVDDYLADLARDGVIVKFEDI